MKKFLPAILILVILAGFFAPLKQARADIVTDFPPVPPPAGSLVATPTDEYVTNSVVVVDPPTILHSTSAQIKFSIKVVSALTDGNPATAGSLPGQLDTHDNLNGWDSLFSSSDLADPAGETSRGVFLQITKTSALSAGVDPGKNNYFPSVSTTPDTLSTGHTQVINLNPIVLIPAIINQNQQPFVVNITTLEPETSYSVRVRLIEQGTPYDSGVYSNTLKFVTGSTANDSGSALTPGGGAAGEGTYDSEAQIHGLLGCSITGSWSGCIVEIMYSVLYVPSSWLLAGAGRLFDVFANLSLSSKIYAGSGFVQDGWAVVRDFANIGFIVALIFIGFKTILGLNSGHDDKAKLATVIIVALMINFSLFITRTVIDSANIFTLIFYNQISITQGNCQTNPCPEVHEAAVVDPNVTGIPEKALSNGLVNGLGVQKIFNKETTDRIENSGSKVSLTALIIILGLAVNLVAAWTFFVSALLFVGRIVGLWFVMIFSPYAFVSYVMPGLADKRMGWKDWWKELLNLSFLAPIFIFFIWLIIKLLDPVTHYLTNFGLTQTATGSGISNFTVFMVSIILQFIIVIFLLMEAKNIAKKMAGELGGVVVGAGTALMGMAAGLAIGGVAKVGQHVIGGHAKDIANDEKLKADAARGDKGAQRKLAVANSLSKSSFDARSTMLGKAAQSSTGMNFDKNLSFVGLSSDKLKGGVKARAEHKAEEHEKKVHTYEMSGATAKENDDYAEKELKKDEAQATENIKAKQVQWDTELEQSVETARVAAAKPTATSPTGTPFTKEDEEKFRKDYAAGKAVSVGGRTVTAPPRPENINKEEFKQAHEKGASLQQFGLDKSGVKTSKAINDERRKAYANSIYNTDPKKEKEKMDAKRSIRGFIKEWKEGVKEALTSKVGAGAAAATVVTGGALVIPAATAVILTGLASAIKAMQTGDKELAAAIRKGESKDKKLLKMLKEQVGGGDSHEGDKKPHDTGSHATKPKEEPPHDTGAHPPAGGHGGH